MEAAGFLAGLGDGGQAAFFTGAFGLAALVIGWLLRRLNGRRDQEPADTRNGVIETVRQMGETVGELRAAAAANELRLIECEEKHTECEERAEALERRVARLEITAIPTEGR